MEVINTINLSLQKPTKFTATMLPLNLTKTRKSQASFLQESGKQLIFAFIDSFEATKGLDPARKAIADSAKWKGNQLEKHAWERHPRLAKDGSNQLPNSKLYDQRARQNILDAGIDCQSKERRYPLY